MKFQYEQRPCKDNDGDIEQCSIDEAQFFGVYKRTVGQGENLAMHVADFNEHADAVAYVMAMNDAATARRPRETGIACCALYLGETIHTDDMEIAIYDEFCGHIGVACEIASFAVMLEDYLGAKPPESFRGVFHYECTPAIAQWLLERSLRVTQADFAQYLTSTFDGWFVNPSNEE